MQLLSGSKLIDYDPQVEEDRKLFEAANKAMGFLITIGQAMAYVFSGMYGDVSEMGLLRACLIVFQLFLASIIVSCLDELLQNGMALDQVSPFSSPPTFARLLSGSPSAHRPSTEEEAANSREPWSLSSI